MKGNVILKIYDLKFLVELVFRWISKELFLKIEIFDRVEEFFNIFKEKIKENFVYVVLFMILLEFFLYFVFFLV